MSKSNGELRAMDCWHFVAPLLPVTEDKFTMDVYVKTFRAFQLLEEEEKNETGS